MVGNHIVVGRRRGATAASGGEPGRSRRRPDAGRPDRPDGPGTTGDSGLVPVPRDGAGCAPDADEPPGTSGLAWLARPVTHVPGILHLVEGRLRFVSTRGVIVDGDPRSLALTPARTGRGGFRLILGDERLRLHVVRFPGAVDVPPELLDEQVVGSLLTAGEPTAGAVWRRLLAPTHPVVAEPAPSEPAAAAEPAPGRSVKARGWRPSRARRACAAPAPRY